MGESLLSVLQMLVQVTVLITFGWLVWLVLRINGGLHAFNPLQPGWGQLRESYESQHPTQPMLDTAMRIGAWTYKDVIQVGFDAEELVLRRSMLFVTYIRIPYSHIALLQAPEPITIVPFLRPVRAWGIFSVGGVKMAFQPQVAEQLQQRLVA